MTNWFDDVIKESLKNETEDSNKFELTISSKDDEEKVKQIMASLGYKIEKIADKKEPCLKSNIGKRVFIKNSMVVASNILIKTSCNLYHINKVILPQGYLGVISSVNNGKYEISFEANLPILPEDIIQGDKTTDLTYPLEKFELSPYEIQVI